MLNKFKKLFYTSILGEYYFRLLLWKEDRKLKKRTKDFVNVSDIKYLITHNINKQNYEQGMSAIKNNINYLLKAKTKEEYQAVLKTIENLIDYSCNITNQPYMDKLKSVYIYKDKDIKNDTDMARMVQQRINDYSELYRHQDSRRLLRDIRTARKNNNHELVHELEQTWKEKYGKRK